MKVIATYNIKGGVGKTATAVNLAYLAAADGYRCLLWDLDPQGAATFYFRVKAKVKGGGRRLFRGKSDLESLIRGTDFEGLDLLPADFSYRHMDLALGTTKKPRKQLSKLLRPLEQEYDLVFLDCAPSISLASENIFAAASVLLVPTIPTPLSLRTLKQLRHHLHAKGPKGTLLLPFFCMADWRRALHRQIAAEADGELFLLRTQIPYSSLVEQMGVRRAPLLCYARSSVPGRAYAALWSEVAALIGLRQARPGPEAVIPPLPHANPTAK
jgi:cellulose biosynthesis protein BcsQ